MTMISAETMAMVEGDYAARLAAVKSRVAGLEAALKGRATDDINFLVHLLNEVIETEKAEIDDDAIVKLQAIELTWDREGDLYFPKTLK